VSESAPIRVPAPALRAHAAALLAALDVPADQAELVAETLVEADLRGVDSHGVNLVRLYFTRIRAGQLEPRTQLRVLRDEGAFLHVDGGLGLGQVAGLFAMDRAIEKAKQHGMGVATVRESSHLGALGYYTLRAAGAGVIALAFQNGPAFVPAHGGLTGIFSTNPLSYAIPAREEPPVVYDVATTTVAGNRILLARKRGTSIPPDWALDAQGVPTTDPQRASLDHLQWFGAHKGYGLGFLVEVLSGVLTDSSFGRTHVSRSHVEGKDRVAKGYLFLTLDPSRILPPGEFERRTDALIRDVHASQPAPGVDRVMVPGEIEYRRRAERLVNGIPLERGQLDDLAGVARELGVAPLTY
jgi:LDH2 family malate/lactate/ureidoglycolate dehydrogenase